MKLRLHGSSACLVGLFLATLLVVSLGFFASIDKDGLTAEKRRLAPLPEVSLAKGELVAFPERFDAYWNDRFGLRERLVFLNNLLRVKLLKVSPNEKIVVGKEGWLFYADEQAMDPAPFTPAMLEMWRVALEAKRDWLASQGIGYVYVVVPEKHTMYPEYLPHRFVVPHKLANVAMLTEYLRKTSDMRVVDLRAPLLKAKATAPVYHMTDTHWNKFGAAVATETVLHAVADRLPAMPGPAFRYRPTVTAKGGSDMAAMLMLQDYMHDAEVEPGCVPEEGAVTVAQEFTQGDASITVLENRRRDLPKAVVFHDSFFKGMKPFFSPSFSRTVLVGGQKVHKFEVDVIAGERPQVVVEEIVERYLTGMPYVPTEILAWYNGNRGK